MAGAGLDLRDPQVLAGVLGAACERRGLSVGQIAEDVGLPFSTAARLASGEFFPTSRHVHMIGLASGDSDLLDQWMATGVWPDEDRCAVLVDLLSGLLDRSNEVLLAMAAADTEISARTRAAITAQGGCDD